MKFFQIIFTLVFGPCKESTGPNLSQGDHAIFVEKNFLTFINPGCNDYPLRIVMLGLHAWISSARSYVKDPLLKKWDQTR
jgi:hypothetical protein